PDRLDEAVRDGRIDDELAAINDRLANLMQQVARLQRGNPAGEPTRTAAPRREELPQQLMGTIARLDERVEQGMLEGRGAAHEIERRVTSVREALASLSREQKAAASAAPASSGLNYSEIDQLLRQLGSQIETLARPSPSDELVQGLRQELAAVNRG